MKHTKEPWEAKADPSYYGIISEIYAGDKFIVGSGGVHSPEEMEANTKRIALCVNACAGITNEALEAGYIQECIDWAKAGEVHNEPKFCGVKVFEEDV